MKVLGKTKDGYIVETTMTELGHAVGFDTYGTQWESFKQKHPKAFDSYGRLEIGAEFEVKKAHDFFSNLESKEKEALKAAGLLRSLADMITNALPTLIVAPLNSEKGD